MRKAFKPHIYLYPVKGSGEIDLTIDTLAYITGHYKVAVAHRCKSIYLSNENYNNCHSIQTWL